ETRVALHPAGDAEPVAAVRRQAHGQVGVDRPGLEGPNEFGLPGGGAGEPAAEGLEEFALMADDRRPVRRDTECEMGGVAPGQSPRGRDGTIFQAFKSERACSSHSTSPESGQLAGNSSVGPASRAGPGEQGPARLAGPTTVSRPGEVLPCAGPAPPPPDDETR